MDKVSAQQWITANLSRKLFMRGLVAVILIYALLIGLAVLKKNDMFLSQQDRLATKTVIIEHKKDRLVFHEQQSENQAAAPSLDDFQPLADAPAEGIYQIMENEDIVPVKSRDGSKTAFQTYRHPFDLQGSDKPYISIAILDMGTSYAASEAALKSMPPEISFVMSPYAPELGLWMKESRMRGHEIWLTLPMETARYPQHDTGPHTLLVEANLVDNQRKLRWLLARPQGYVGFVTPYNATFMDSQDDMRPIFTDILERGLGFVDTRKDGFLMTENIALGLEGPYANVPVYIDMPADNRKMEEKLAKIEERAIQNGAAAGFIHTLPASYDLVLKWVQSLESKGFVLAPLSAQTGR